MTTPQERLNAQVVQAMAFSAYAASLGVAIATMGHTLEAAAPPEPVLRDLRMTFGSKIVDEAIKNVGKEDVLILAKEIDRLFVADLREKYGDYATDAALQAAPPLEAKKVHEIAKIISGKGITAVTPGPVAEQGKEVAKKRAVMKYPPQALKDTETGVIYKSMHNAYVNVAPELGMDPGESMGIYSAMKKFPDRFKKVSMDEYLKYKAKEAK